MRDVALGALYVLFLIVVALVGWQFRQDIRASNYCQSIRLGWHRTEDVFSRAPTAVCMQTTPYQLQATD